MITISVHDLAEKLKLTMLDYSASDFTSHDKPVKSENSRFRIMYSPV